MTRKLKDEELIQHESKRDVWQEVLDSIDEIKARQGKRTNVTPKNNGRARKNPIRTFAITICRNSRCIQKNP
jgi:hypothetical protein